MNTSIPILQALLIADKIYVDKDTGKHVIAGVFRDIILGGSKKTESSQEAGSNSDHEELVSVTPLQFVQMGTPSVYISMVGVHGSRGFCLRFVSLKDHSVVFETRFDVDCKNPLEVIEITMPLPPLHLNGVGAHALELLCADEPLGEFRVNVRKIETQG